MARNRYHKDYRVFENFDEKGHVHLSTEYIGKPYHFQDPEKAGKRRKELLLLALTGWLLYVGAMLLPSAAMRTVYIAVPFALLALPLFWFTHNVLAFRGMGGTHERRHADVVNNDYPASAFFLMVLPAFSFLLLISAVTGGRGRAGDIVFALCCAGLTAAGARGFILRKEIQSAAEDGK